MESTRTRTRIRTRISTRTSHQAENDFRRHLKNVMRKHRVTQDLVMHAYETAKRGDDPGELMAFMTTMKQLPRKTFVADAFNEIATELYKREGFEALPDTAMETILSRLSPRSVKSLLSVSRSARETATDGFANVKMMLDPKYRVHFDNLMLIDANARRLKRGLDLGTLKFTDKVVFPPSREPEFVTLGAYIALRVGNMDTYVEKYHFDGTYKMKIHFNKIGIENSTIKYVFASAMGIMMIKCKNDERAVANMTKMIGDTSIPVQSWCISDTGKKIKKTDGVFGIVQHMNGGRPYTIDLSFLVELCASTPIRPSSGWKKNILDFIEKLFERGYAYDMSRLSTHARGVLDEFSDLKTLLEVLINPKS